MWTARGRSVRFERRVGVLVAVLIVLILAVGAFALTLGDYDIPVGQVLAALTGRATDPLAGWFVTGVRLPRVLTALLVGAALGVSGGVFQTISGNPLGSPDIIGFTTGASTGALLTIVALGGSQAGTTVGALVGGLATAVLVYLLSWRAGVTGFRLVLVGIGVSAALHAANTLLVARAELRVAQTAQQWLSGSLNASTWEGLALLGLSLLILCPFVVWSFRGLALLPLGDDLSRGLGVPVERLRLVAVLAAVALVSVATATTGPIAFVALAAPHVARRLAHTAGPGLFCAALTGALLVLVSDVLAQRLFAPTQLAVGVVTGALGGVYLIVLLATEWRRHRA
ncbi:iron chelate uptake ABC transporter family permease subunit [Tessaracoccus palaemonis]|uniref:Iron chelate uptake ABC transporter family permease subunit n=1 Tax=Tessaracoccus palaemonis TaxID=2829499 RepID=A0ABX8SQ39_9ACTN|nr:iron chelate uptake ABC transporter family permease subunit [Tessaracoccus palaemonis]